MFLIPEGWENLNAQERRRIRQRHIMRERKNVKNPVVSEDRPTEPFVVQRCGGWEAYNKLVEGKNVAKPRIKCECGYEIAPGWFQRHKESGLHQKLMSKLASTKPSP